MSTVKPYVEVDLTYSRHLSGYAAAVAPVMNDY
jgi:hypothetical protein